MFLFLFSNLIKVKLTYYKLLISKVYSLVSFGMCIHWEAFSINIINISITPPKLLCVPSNPSPPQVIADLFSVAIRLACIFSHFYRNGIIRYVFLFWSDLFHSALLSFWLLQINLLWTSVYKCSHVLTCLHLLGLVT